MRARAKGHNAMAQLLLARGAKGENKRENTWP
jgi:hypothetical protein